MTALLAMADQYDCGDTPLLIEVLANVDEDSQLRSSTALVLGKLLNSAIPPALEDTDDEKAMTLLTRLMGDEEQDTVRAYIVTALGLSERDEAIPAVLGGLKDPDLKVFHNAAEALPRFDRRIVPHLIDVLAHGANDAQCISAWKLGEMGYSEGIEPLLAVANSDYAHEELKALAIWALGEIGYRRPGVMEALQAASQHPKPAIHERAKLAIKKIARNCN